MFDLMKLPEIIFDRISGQAWVCDEIGESGATILMFDEMVLKIEKTSQSSKNEKELLDWLDAKLPAPKIIAAATQDGYSFLLMSKLSGEMACSDSSLRNMEDTVKALARGLKMLWQINIIDCPCSNTVAEKLIQAKYNIENGLVDIEEFDEDTLGPEGFADVPALYNFLEQNRPQEDFVFSHGDLCLPNVFVSGKDVTGFLDWGSGGIADRWQDIALCVRSLRYNCVYCAGHSEAAYQGFRGLLFRELGIPPDKKEFGITFCLMNCFDMDTGHPSVSPNPDKRPYTKHFPGSNHLPIPAKSVRQWSK